MIECLRAHVPWPFACFFLLNMGNFCCQQQSAAGQALIWAECAQVVKVLHGADSDIVWLQRDFGIYVVNLFDTGQAARVLAYPSAGLAYLLSRMCGVKVRLPLC